MGKIKRLVTPAASASDSVPTVRGFAGKIQMIGHGFAKRIPFGKHHFLGEIRAILWSGHHRARWQDKNQQA